MAVSARDRIIEAAHEQFYRVGFHTVGLDAILNEVGVTKTTFYNHFESKEDLVREVLEWHDHWWQDTFRQMLRKHGGDKPRDQLLAIPNVLDEFLQRDDFNGCFFVNVAVQFPQAHDPAHEAAAKHKRAMESIIREIAGYAGAANAVAFAQEMSLLMEGAYVTRQVTRDVNTMRVAGRLMKMLVESHLPAS